MRKTCLLRIDSFVPKEPCSSILGESPLERLRDLRRNWMMFCKNMQNTQESYAKQFIENARATVRCQWCARDKDLNRRGLCGSCNAGRRQHHKGELLNPRTGSWERVRT